MKPPDERPRIYASGIDAAPSMVPDAVNAILNVATPQFPLRRSVGGDQGRRPENSIRTAKSRSWASTGKVSAGRGAPLIGPTVHVDNERGGSRPQEPLKESGFTGA